MSKVEEHQILDAARAGIDVGDDLINTALVVTGDLCGWMAA
ncbi:MAG: hypothetical protein Q7T97_02385 [Burkholderiaceae bacterium]|nr:hypothetical protein [Burkholderiaceae bacterium]